MFIFKNLDDLWPSRECCILPLLDDPLKEEECSRVILTHLKPKIAGPDGNSPETFHLLPAQWLSFLTLLLSLVFTSALYPVAWTKAKLSMLFKKGNSLLTGNYRGISVIDSICKLYDYILNNRLISWYIPQREQAGGQSERDCVEHIMTLRLIIDYARKTRQKLFIAKTEVPKKE